MKRLIALFCVLALSACAHIPFFRRWARKPYIPYEANPRFSFEYPRGWSAGVAIPGGIEFRDPKGRAAFSAAFYARGSKEYKPPELYRQYMSGWGAVEDAHRAYKVVVSSRTGYQVQFTTYDYDPEYLLGERYRVWFTEATMLPEADGLFVLRYHAPRSEFWKNRHRRHYLHFLKSLALTTPPEE